jgi:hypothetical protein
VSYLTNRLSSLFLIHRSTKLSHKEEEEGKREGMNGGNEEGKEVREWIGGRRKGKGGGVDWEEKIC